MRDSQILHQKDGCLLEGGKVFLTCNSHPEDGMCMCVCVWGGTRGGSRGVEGRGQNKTVTISTASFTCEELRTTRSNMVQTTVQCQSPERAGLGAQPEIHPSHHHHQQMWENPENRLRSGYGILLFQWGLFVRDICPMPKQ